MRPVLAAQVRGIAERYARGRPLTEAEETKALASIITGAAGRTELLAQTAGLALGWSEITLGELPCRQAADLAIKAGADPELISVWIEEGRRRAQAVASVGTPAEGGIGAVQAEHRSQQPRPKGKLAELDEGAPKEHNRGAKRKIRAALAGAAASITVIAALATIILAGPPLRAMIQPRRTVTYSPLDKEQKMLGRLIAGDDYAKLRSIIGTDPDSHFSAGSHYEVFQFDRRWEYIDLLVNKGTVVSLGVYTKTARLRAVLHAGGYPVTLNDPSIARQTRGDGTPVDAIANCDDGDSPNWFFEDFSLSMTDEMASFALGWSESPVAIRATPAATLKVPDIACWSNNGTPPKCSNLETFYTPSQAYLNCIQRAGTLQEINKLSPSAIVITEPYHQPMDELLSIVPSNSG